MRKDSSVWTDRGYIWAHTKLVGSCWIWVGTVVGMGYGQAWRWKRKWRAHRLAYEIYRGPIPRCAVVRHTCDKPRCCNPRHLKLGTVADNQRDMVSRGRSLRGTKQARSKLTDAKVRRIRRLASSVTQTALAAKFGVCQHTVWSVIRRLTWRHC